MGSSKERRGIPNAAFVPDDNDISDRRTQSNFQQRLTPTNSQNTDKSLEVRMHNV